MSEIRSYRDLRVWQHSVDFAADLYRRTGSFPKTEMYGLTNQMRRAAVSIASNIAEGHQRSRREFARFLTFSLGSLAELETQLEIARRIGYLAPDEFTELNDQLTSIGKQLTVLSKKIKG